MELLTIEAVQPVGATAVPAVGSAGRKNWPGIQEYQTLPMGEVAPAPSLKIRSYVYGPEPDPLMVPMPISPWASAKVAAPAAMMRVRKVVFMVGNILDDSKNRVGGVLLVVFLFAQESISPRLTR